MFWDTNVFIYLIEQRPRDLADIAARARERVTRDGDQLVTSALTLGEVLVQPLRAGKSELATRYATMLGRGCLILPFDEGAARRYGEIRAEFPAVRPPDAVQLACAAQQGTAVFVTNDARLEKIRVRGVQAIKALRDLAT